jgi:Xaa-Pro aminopeptidase
MTGKVEKVREWMAGHGLAAVALGGRDSFSWITDGGDNHIVSASDMGVAYVVVTADKTAIVTANIEHQRIADEELARLQAEVLSHPYYENRKAEMIRSLASGRIAADDPALGFEPIPGDFYRLRYVLTPEEVARMRDLCATTARLMGEATRAVKPGMTEHEIAADIARRFYADGIEPMVDLVASDERIHKYRHPIPTDKRVDKYAMLVVCARKMGLIAAVTRLVHFGPLPDELRKKQEALCQVDLRFILATKPGRSVRDVYADGVAEYAKAGYPDEWQLHHQGGAIGYKPREYFGSSFSEEVVHENQAFAWNPSITGTKVEDTILVTASGAEVLTPTPGWPMINVTLDGVTVARPAVLEV